MMFDKIQVQEVADVPVGVFETVVNLDHDELDGPFGEHLYTLCPVINLN